MGLPLEVMTKSFSSDSTFQTEADWLRNSRTLTLLCYVLTKDICIYGHCQHL